MPLSMKIQPPNLGRGPPSRKSWLLGKANGTGVLLARGAVKRKQTMYATDINARKRWHSGNNRLLGVKNAKRGK